MIPQLEVSLSVQFDQFSLVGDVLHQVLDLAQPQLDPREGYTLYHVRLRMRSVNYLQYCSSVPTCIDRLAN